MHFSEWLTDTLLVFVFVGLILVVLQVTKFISISWWLVFAPWIIDFVVVVGLVVYFIYLLGSSDL